MVKHFLLREQLLKDVNKCDKSLQMTIALFNISFLSVITALCHDLRCFSIFLRALDGIANHSSPRYQSHLCNCAQSQSSDFLPNHAWTRVLSTNCRLGEYSCCDRGGHSHACVHRLKARLRVWKSSIALQVCRAVYSDGR